jgi:hypothetical protein
MSSAARRRRIADGCDRQPRRDGPVELLTTRRKARLVSTVDPDSGATIPENGTAPFPNPGETALDYDAQAQAEVLHQYKESTKLRATITALMSGWQAIEDCAVNISKQRDLTTTDPTGTVDVNLDVTGELVGQSRVLSSGTILTNAMYLLLIALRIKRNNSIGSSPEFLDYLTFVFQTYPGTSTPFRYYDLGGMAVGIEVGTGAPPSADQLALLDNGPSPRAMAVGVGREWYHADDYFAFAEDTGAGAKGFGLASDPTVGGKLAMLF